MLEMAEVQTVARGLGIEVAPLEIRRAEDIASAFEALKGQADALYVVGDALINANRTRIITFSLSARLPMIFNTRSFVQACGLMSYGPNVSDLFGRTAELVDKISEFATAAPASRRPRGFPRAAAPPRLPRPQLTRQMRDQPVGRGGGADEAPGPAPANRSRWRDGHRWRGWQTPGPQTPPQ
jgi:hypothetical protein